MTNYNGWTNWETWNVSLWMQNDEDLYRSFWGESFNADEAEAHVRCLMPEGTPDMDGADGGYDAVNWDEIAEMMSEGSSND